MILVGYIMHYFMIIFTIKLLNITNQNDRYTLVMPRKPFNGTMFQFYHVVKLILTFIVG